ncbi:MAG: hypothetical protein LBQ23_00385 [Puniceicoccales bacterium]|jgi:hypothetical protein|nr:hypothetical protein [Puniceicoccales bacterium]
MVNSSATFPIFGASDSSQDFLAKARALAAEEHVSLPKYLAGMLRHAIRGDNLANIHFYQDGSGDTYDVEEVRRTHEETLAEDAAGELKTFDTAEEGLAYLDEIKKAVETKGHAANA